MAKAKDCIAQEDGDATRGTAVPPTDTHRHRRRHGRRRQRPLCPPSNTFSSAAAVLSSTFLIVSAALSLGSYAGASSSMSNEAAALLPLSKFNDNYHLRGRRIQEWEDDDDDDDDDDVDVDEDEDEDDDNDEDATLVAEEEDEDDDEDDDEDEGDDDNDDDDDDEDASLLAEEEGDDEDDDDNDGGDVDAAVDVAEEPPVAAATEAAAAASDPAVATTVNANGEEFMVTAEEEEGLIPGTAAPTETEPAPCLTEEECRDKATELDVDFSVHDHPSLVGCYLFNGMVHWVEGGTEEEMTADTPDPKKERLWCDTAHDVVPEIAAAATSVATSSVGNDVDEVAAGSTTSGDGVEGEAEDPLVPANDKTELEDLEKELDDVNQDLAELESLEMQAIIEGNSTATIEKEIEDLAELDKELMGEVMDKTHEQDKVDAEEDRFDEIDKVEDEIDDVEDEIDQLESLEMQEIIEGNSTASIDEEILDLEEIEDGLIEEALSELESLKEQEILDGINSTTSIDEEIEDLEELEEDLIDEAMEKEYELENGEIDDDFGDSYGGDGVFNGESVDDLEKEIDEIEEEIEDIEEGYDNGSFSEEKEEYIENLEELEKLAEEELEEEEEILENEALGDNITASIESLAGDLIDPTLTMDLTTMNPPPIWGNDDDDEDGSVLANNVTNAKEVSEGASGSTVKESESPPFKMDTEPERVKPSDGEVDTDDVGDVAAVTAESDDENDNDVITGANVVPCLTQEACQKKATELSADFSVHESSTKGCYLKHEVVYWVEDGTEEEMTSIPDSSKKTRVWCNGDDQELAAAAALKVKAPSVEPERAVDEAKALAPPSVGNATEPTEEAESESEDKEDGSSADVASAETSAPTQQPDEAEVSTTLPPTHAPSPKATEAPFPTSEPTANDNDGGTSTTSQPTSRPSVDYIEPNDDTLDPLTNEPSTVEEAFEDGEEPSSNGSIEEDVEEEVKKVGGWLSFASIILMIYTAYQMSENPDGICASLCRLVITVVGCIIKIMLIPFKYIMGGRQSGGHYMATPDYRDPYGSRHMELT